jgi:hypothetical protein
LVGLGVFLHIDTCAYKEKNDQRLSSYENNADQQIKSNMVRGPDIYIMVYTNQ